MMHFTKAPSHHLFRRTVITLVAFFVLGMFLMLPPAASAQTALEQFGESTRLSDTSPVIMIARGIRAFLGFTGIIMTILVMYAGYLYMTSQGVPAKMDKAKTLIKQAVIGMLIMWMSFSLSWWILNMLLQSTQVPGVVATAKKYGEPLKGSLGAGIINSTYPVNDAKDIPRNTKIFVEFKEAINPASIIAGYSEGDIGGPLNVGNVKIFETESGQGAALAQDAVFVSFDVAKKIFVFKPVNYLGSSEMPKNITVELLPGIEKLDGKAAFSGAHNKGFSWHFQVSTEVDLSPPQVESVIPLNNANEPRNISVEVTFNEAIDPTVSTGRYLQGQPPLFTNISTSYHEIVDGVEDPDASLVEGIYEISNAYRTVTFTTTVACGQDPCGDVIYCLPPEKDLDVLLKAADVDPENLPQAQLIGALPNGIADAAGNSLDGNADGKGCQGVQNAQACPAGANDSYAWSFHTTDEINDTVPEVVSLNPDKNQGNISLTDPITATFNVFMKGSTINSSTVSLWPRNYTGDVVDSWWFHTTKQDQPDPQNRSILSINHPTLVALEQGAEDYYPVFDQGLKSAYQICLFPASLSGSDCEGNVSAAQPYCCNGTPSTSRCTAPALEQGQDARPLPLNE